jgi:bifunctional DNase/RNase
MTVEGIRVSLMNYQRVVILKEKDADRYLPIWIGPAEADAIAVRLQEVSVARPLTHDLLRSTLEALGARVNCIMT